ncbi:MAG: hypothetical protein RIC30_04360 [Marinoscillum sp.]|uniref:hypothetical protein n=1 Tax=Marinoscillum sp. TaxID=2024838 RepID=UPI0032F557AD
MRLLLTFIFATLVLLSSAQQKGDLSIALMSESIAFPLTRLAPIHPGAEVGYTLYVWDQRTPRVLNVYMGGYHHERVENGIFLRVEQSHQFGLTDWLATNLAYGLGYMHTFYPGELYEVNPRTGEFEKINQLGRAHALATVGIGFTWVNDSPVLPFVRQDLALETPFANGIPVIIHSFLKVGVNVKLQSL